MRRSFAGSQDGAGPDRRTTSGNRVLIIALDFPGRYEARPKAPLAILPPVLLRTLNRRYPITEEPARQTHIPLEEHATPLAMVGE
jgi:hypothetical protein